MDKKVVLALLDSLVEEAVSKIKLPEAVQGESGPRGLRGKDGNDFDLDTHKDEIESLIRNVTDNLELSDEQVARLKGRDGKDFNPEANAELIRNLILENIPKNFELTDEQITLLKGKDGQDGRDGVDGIDGRKGKDGRDGKDFDFQEHREDIESIIKEASLKFSDLTDDEIESLRGPKGKDGEDFSFENSREEINGLVVSYLTEVRELLTLKFSDLTDDEKESIRGPRGQRGKAGKDFVLEDALPAIESKVVEQVNNLAPDLKLKFSDLSEEEKDSLKLKFDHITPEERLTLRGPRGQRGKQGIQGESGKDGIDGVDGKDGAAGTRGQIGPQGLSGKNGRDGKDGKDGEDAPRITDVEVEQDKKEFNLVFKFEDGSEIRSSDITLPKGDTVFYYPQAIGGGGGSGGGGSATVLKGEGIPDEELGEDGYVYLDSLNLKLYGPKDENGWGTPIPLSDGEQGPQGIQGEVGPQGLQGLQGEQGPQGPQGLQGEQGPQGIQGEVGPQGLQGEQGPQGIQGEVGPEGEFAIDKDGVPVASFVRKIDFRGVELEVVPVSYIGDWASLSEIDKMTYIGDNPTVARVTFVPPEPTTPAVAETIKKPNTVISGWTNVTGDMAYRISDGIMFGWGVLVFSGQPGIGGSSDASIAIPDGYTTDYVSTGLLNVYASSLDLGSGSFWDSSTASRIPLTMKATAGGTSLEFFVRDYSTPYGIDVVMTKTLPVSPDANDRIGFSFSVPVRKI